MIRLRAFLLVLVLACGIAGGGVVPAQVATAAPVSTMAAASVEDAATQTRTFGEAYNLLLDHYVHPVSSAAMLQAAWDNLAKEADGKAPAPGPAPTFSGDRAVDLQRMRD